MLQPSYFSYGFHYVANNISTKKLCCTVTCSIVLTPTTLCLFSDNIQAQNQLSDKEICFTIIIHNKKLERGLHTAETSLSCVHYIQLCIVLILTYEKQPTVDSSKRHMDGLMQKSSPVELIRIVTHKPSKAHDCDCISPCMVVF